MTALAYALHILTALPGLIQAGVEVHGIVTKYRDRLAEMQAEGRDPTPHEWDELNAEIDRLRGELHAANTPPIAGEDDGS